MSNKFTDTALNLLMIEKDILSRIDYSNGFIYNDKICDPPYNLNQITCEVKQ